MKNIKNILILLLTALIWGVAFVAQTTGGDVVGPYSFICIRYIIGGLVLIPVIKFLDSRGLSGGKPVTPIQKRILIKGGILCGLCLFFASVFQQLGLYFGTPAGKAGFLTTCYIILVPIYGLFLKKRCGLNIWVAVVITVAGLYMLCLGEALTIQTSDVLVLICSALFALHIMIIDNFVDRVDPVRMSCIQFFTAGILAIVPMIFSDMQHSAAGYSAWVGALASWDAWLPILYAGIMSSGVAYTLQIIGQKGFNPTIASLIMSLESVFSVLAGWLILSQKLGLKEILGCVLIFAAVIIAQIEFGGGRNRE